MLQKFKNKVKDQRGFTLIELLAVIVILGIIAAIAIPSVLGLIDNTKKDAHVSNANELISATKMAIANNSDLQQTGTKVVTLEYLLSANYIEPIKDPDSDNPYVTAPTAGSITIASLATTEPTATDAIAAAKAYVVVTNGKVVGVKLAGSTRGVQGDDKKAVDVTTTPLKRTNVKLN